MGRPIHQHKQRVGYDFIRPTSVAEALVGIITSSQRLQGKRYSYMGEVDYSEFSNSAEQDEIMICGIEPFRAHWLRLLYTDKTVRIVHKNYIGPTVV